MRRSNLTRIVLCLILIVAAVGTGTAKEKKGKPGQLNGTVRMINKEASTISVRKGNVERQIVYGANTKFVKGTQKNSTPSSIDELKEGWYAHCWGTFDGIKLVADRCRIREEQRTTQP